MRAQVFLIPCTAFQDLPDDSKTVHALASGLLQGFLVNCTDNDYLMSVLELAADMKHDVSIVMLKDNEPWPTVEARRETWLRANKA